MLHDVLQVVLSVLPQDIIELKYKTYWLMKLYAEKHGLGVNISLESKFIKASEYVKSDIEENYLTFFDNAQQEIYSEEKKIIFKIEGIGKEHIEVSNKKIEELEKHNKTIDDKNYENKLIDKRNKMGKYAHGGLLGPSLFTICIVIIHIVYLGVTNKNYYLEDWGLGGSMAMGGIYLLS